MINSHDAPPSFPERFVTTPGGFLSMKVSIMKTAFVLLTALLITVPSNASPEQHQNDNNNEIRDSAGDDRGLSNMGLGYDKSFGMESPEDAAERLKKEAKYKERDERTKKE